MTTVISDQLYTNVAFNLRRIFPEIGETFRVLQAWDGTQWLMFPTPEVWTAKQLTEHMVCFGYTAYQLELSTVNGCRRPDVYAAELTKDIPVEPSDAGRRRGGRGF